MVNLRNILPAWIASKKTHHRPDESFIDDFRKSMKDVTFSFREGFSDRVTARLNNLIESDPIEIYYKNLSRLFPKILGFSLTSIIILGMILFVLHGNIDPGKLIGADRVDESNFITYLILED